MEEKTKKEEKIMRGSTMQPRVFMSYSWSSPQHEKWVSDFADRLVGDGIFVVLDKWDLKEGQDKHVFMEKMVNDSDINKVLVICDKEYQAKADNREGGVGTETQLISKEVYENTGQEKFIAIIKELDSEGKPCLPHFMVSRIYIDLSSDGVFEENYEKLIRNLYNKPASRRPPLGTPPAYIAVEESIILKTSHKVAQIRSAILNDRKSTEGLIRDYLDSFLASLNDFRIQGGARSDFDESVLESIDKMLPLRNDFLEFVDTVFKYGDKIDLDKFHSFFENLISFQFRPQSITSWTDIDFDNYKFLLYELFLYFITMLFNLKKYEEASFFIHSQYFFNSNSGELSNLGIEGFNSYIRSLDEIRNKRLNLRRISVTADLIKQRADRPNIKFDKIIETDLVLYYLTNLEGNRFAWFPRCSVYNPRFWGRIELFEKMISLQHFNRIKVLFQVEDIDSFKKKYQNYLIRIEEGSQRHYVSFDYEIPPLEKVVKIEVIGTIK